MECSISPTVPPGTANRGRAVKYFRLPHKTFKYSLIFSHILIYAALARAQVTVTPATISFNNVPVGQSAGQSAVLSNSTTLYVKVTQATVSGAGFSVNIGSLPVTLAPSQNLNFSVAFAPQVAGNVSGNVSLVYSASSSPGQGHFKKTGFSSTAMTVPLSGSTTNVGQLVPTPTSLAFGSLQMGANQTQSVTLNNSGSASVTISQATVTGSGFSLGTLNFPLTLAAGQTATLNVTFTPLSSGAISGNLAIANNGSNPTLNVVLSGTGATPASLSPNPSSISFGTLAVGTNLAKLETLTNSGGSSLTITQASTSGAGFSLSGLNLPQSLSAGQSVTFSVAFAPTVSGTASGTLSLLSNASNPNLSIPLSGSSTTPGQLTLSPTALSFGNVVVGTSSSPQPASLSASGSSVSISSATSSSSEFVVSGITFPLTLNAGQTVPFSVTFTPQISGTASGTISFSSNASNSTQTETVTGSGTAPLQHSVDLSWNGSTSAVVGYNIYRGGQAGGPYVKLNSTIDATTSYTDSSVQSGQNYYYVTTAVNSSGVESGYSNEISAAIPTP